MEAGCRWVVDIDLESFFDRVNHDVLMTPVLRGWINWYRLSEVNGVIDALDQWFRRRLRVILWRQAKRARTGVRMLRRRGIDEARARASSSNGLGPWWNAGKSHMNQAFPTSYFRAAGLVPLLDQLRILRTCSS